MINLKVRFMGKMYYKKNLQSWTIGKDVVPFFSSLNENELEQELFQMEKRVKNNPGVIQDIKEVLQLLADKRNTTAGQEWEAFQNKKNIKKSKKSANS